MRGQFLSPPMNILNILKPIPIYFPEILLFPKRSVLVLILNTLFEMEKLKRNDQQQSSMTIRSSKMYPVTIKHIQQG